MVSENGKGLTDWSVMEKESREWAEMGREDEMTRCWRWKDGSQESQPHEGFEAFGLYVLENEGHWQSWTFGQVGFGGEREL